jgi:hypothetical protein
MDEFSEFIRTPFPVEALQITEENMEEVCKLIGLEIKSKGNVRYILVDRRIVPLGTKAYVGSWVTRMGVKLRCYPNHIFTKQFVPMTDEWKGWIDKDEDEDDSSLEETLEIVNDPETMEAIAEAEGEVTGRNGEEDGTAPTSAAHVAAKPQVGDTYEEDVNAPYTS